MNLLIKQATVIDSTSPYNGKVVDILIEKGIINLTEDVLKATLHRAAVAAGITCSRKGAQPPY